MAGIVLFHHHVPTAVAYARANLPGRRVHVCGADADADVYICSDLRQLGPRVAVALVLVLTLDDAWLVPAARDALRSVHAAFFTHLDWQKFEWQLETQSLCVRVSRPTCGGLWART